MTLSWAKRFGVFGLPIRLTALIAAAALSMMASFGFSVTAFAQADCKTLVKASPFGPDDETGATNRVTAAVTKAAAAEIQTGTVTPMAYNLVEPSTARTSSATWKTPI